MSALARTAVTKLILTLGRYAVLVPVAVALAVFAVWFAAIDAHPAIARVTAVVVVPLATSAVFLAYGLLLLPPKKAVPGVAETAAPGVWALWRKLDPRPSARRTLVIDADFNASIRERRRFMGLFGRHMTLTIGLPLLIVLDERAVRAVVAHEVAHAELAHTSGTANLVEFIAAAENIFEYADPDATITGAVALALLSRLLAWLEGERLARSRRNEFEADRRAGEAVGAAEMARSVVLVAGLSRRLDDLVFEPLNKELLGAIRAPRPPLQRIIGDLEQIRMPGPVAAAARAGMTAGEDDADASHPSLRQRLANLGFADLPDIDPVQASAAATLLDAAACADLVAAVDGRWSRWAASQVEIAWR